MEGIHEAGRLFALFPRRLARIVALGILAASLAEATEPPRVDVSGELVRWHKVTLTLHGPRSSEDAVPNPFTDYRMDVSFAHPETGLRYRVPGYFAADGSAANSSAAAGDRWRAHLSPDHAGLWTYAVSFRAGPGVAVAADPGAGAPLAPFDGLAGSFRIAETRGPGGDPRARGRLQYVGAHQLRFAGTGEWFLKMGADSPENFLAYDGFDGTPDAGGRRKSWGAHARDWRPGDPTWKGGLGKGIVGVLNYLADRGMNAQSFLTYSYHGDDGNVFPYADPRDRLRMDCSKLDQWEVVFEHADARGVYLHFKTQETENDQDLDGGELGPERRLYYRELIARFGHHLALGWNLGEENSNTVAQRRAFAQFFHDHDPYQHLRVVHTFPGAKRRVFEPLLGSRSWLTGASLQSRRGGVFADTRTWVRRSAEAGRPWVVSSDEQGPPGAGIACDRDDPSHDRDRKRVLWANLMAGGAGVESYYGYETCAGDLGAQDHRTRERWWDQCRHALELMREVPFWRMESRSDLVSSGKCLAGEDHYVVYLPGGGSTTLDLSGARGRFEVRWYDPRAGGPLRPGSVTTVEGGARRSLGDPPARARADWVVLVRRGAVTASGGSVIPNDEGTR
jgi:Domain of unknown function (DUF5060)/Putative collagen-binding domain of a collagenase